MNDMFSKLMMNALWAMSNDEFEAVLVTVPEDERQLLLQARATSHMVPLTKIIGAVASLPVDVLVKIKPTFEQIINDEKIPSQYRAVVGHLFLMLDTLIQWQGITKDWLDTQPVGVANETET